MQKVILFVDFFKTQCNCGVWINLNFKLDFLPKVVTNLFKTTSTAVGVPSAKPPANRMQAPVPVEMFQTLLTNKKQGKITKHTLLTLLSKDNFAFISSKSQVQGCPFSVVILGWAESAFQSEHKTPAPTMYCSVVLLYTNSLGKREVLITAVKGRGTQQLVVFKIHRLLDFFPFFIFFQHKLISNTYCKERFEASFKMP